MSTALAAIEFFSCLGLVVSGAVLEAPALVAGLDDVAMVGQPIQQRRGHPGVAEDARPLAGARRKFCVWRSCGGVILGVFNRLSIAKLYAVDDLTEAVGAVQSAPVTFSGFDQLEHHGERGVA